MKTKIKLFNMLVVCCLLILCSCGQEEEINNVLESQQPGSESSETAKKELTTEEQKAKRQALQFVMYENLADEHGMAVDSNNISSSELEGKMVKYDENDVLLDGMDIGKAEIATQEGSQTGEKENILNITFTSKGADKFAEATAKAVGAQIAILSNGKLISAPTVYQEITDGKCVISISSADVEEIQNLVDALN